MRTVEDLNEMFASILKDLRIKHELSQSKMADMFFVGSSTWKRYENGTSAPTGPEMMHIFDELGENILLYFMNYLHPDIYSGLTAETPISDLRKAAAHFITDVASDKMVREFCYLMFGDTGSSPASKLDEMTMIDHLSLRDRVVLASLVDNLFSVAEAKNELIQADHVMPDVENFRAGYIKGREAVISGKSGYTTVIL